MRSSSPWLVSLAAVLLAAGAYGSPASGDSRREEELRRRVTELEQHQRVSEVEIARLRQEIARLQRELQAAREEAEMAHRNAVLARAEPSRAPEEAVLAPEAIQEDDVPEEELEIADVPPAAPEPRKALPAPPPPAAVPTSPPPAAVPTSPPPAAVPTSPPPAEPVTVEVRELYDASYTLFHERRYDEAAASFTRFLELHPHTDLSDNAQFWLGECHYARGDYDSALTAFMATVERYPSGNKIPDALVKAGKSLEGLGDREGAVETYREILRRFEGTAAAAIASERLVAMNAR